MSCTPFQVAAMGGLLAIFWMTSGSVLGKEAETTECVKCKSQPEGDCIATNEHPALGGPPCYCTQEVALLGCVLKPCRNASDNEICHCSSDSSNRAHCFNYRCSGEDGHCQSCTKELPPLCTSESYKHPPAYGGPPCTCKDKTCPTGCTLKPCTYEQEKMRAPIPCICNRKVRQMICFDPLCPGSDSSKGGVILSADSFKMVAMVTIGILMEMVIV